MRGHDKILTFLNEVLKAEADRYQSVLFPRDRERQKPAGLRHNTA